MKTKWTLVDPQDPSTLPPLKKDVLVWRPWGSSETEVKHLLKGEAAVSGGGTRAWHSWYPGGSDVRGTYWREFPELPTSVWNNETSKWEVQLPN